MWVDYRLWRPNHSKALRLFVHDVGLLYLAVCIKSSNFFGALELQVIVFVAIVGIIHGVHVAVDDATFFSTLVLIVDKLLSGLFALV